MPAPSVSLSVSRRRRPLDLTKLYALSSISAYSFYQTLADGGEAGVASGFGGVALVVPRALTAINQMYAGRLSTGAGWQVGIVNTNDLGVYTFPFLLASCKFGAAKVGRVFVDFFQVTPAQSRVMQDRLDTAGVATVASYAPASSASVEQIGMSGSASPSIATDHIAHLRWRGTPTDAQLIVLADLIRTLGDVPSKAAAEAVMPGTTITHRWSLRDVLIARGGLQSGQIAPPSLPDSATAAGIDAMARAGTPTVVVIDPSIDGRVSYGSLGTNDANYLEAPLGIRGAATGFTLVFAVRFDAAASGSVVLISNYNGTPTGYTIYSNSGQIRIYRAGTGDLVIGTAAAVDVGVTKLVAVTWDGTTWRTYDQGVAGATSVAGMTPAVLPMTVGTYPTHASGGTGISSLFAVAGCDAALSAGDIAEVLASWRATGRINLPSGKPNTRSWDITQDIIANGGPANGIPATVLDRVGTDHLTRSGGLAVVANGSATGLRGFGSNARFIATPNGFAGAAAGFWASVLAAPQTLTGVRILFGKSNHGAAGWALSINGSYILAYISDAGVITQGPQFNMGSGAGYLNTPTHIALVLSAGMLRLYVNGTEVGTPLAVTTFNPGTTSMVIGATANGTVYGAGGVDIFGAAGGHFVPTAGEIATASADSLSSGSIAAVPAKTSHRYDLKADIADAGGAVPVRSVERTSGVDTMAVVNTKLEVAQRAERLWSYEATPILRGLESFSDANYHTGPNPETAADYAAGWWGSLVFVVPSQAVTSQTRDLIASYVANQGGFLVRFSGALSMLAMNGALTNDGVNSGGTHVLASADVGKMQVFIWTWDAAQSRFRSMLRRVEVSGSTAAAPYKPAANGLWIGREVLAARDANGLQLYGVQLGRGILTTVEMYAHHDALVAADGRMVAPSLRTPDLLIDCTDDVAGGGAAPATLTNKINAATYARTGTPTVALRYARAFG